MPSRGITEEQMEELILWCTQFKQHQKIIFFDWDRTISVLEGMFALQESSFSKKQRIAYIKYVLGGRERFVRLRNLFRILHRMQVHIYILSNNYGLIDPNKRPHLVKLFQLIDPKLIDDRIIATRGFSPNLPLKSNKTVALQTLKPIWSKIQDIQIDQFPSLQQITRQILSQIQQDVQELSETISISILGKSKITIPYIQHETVDSLYHRLANEVKIDESRIKILHKGKILKKPALVQPDVTSSILVAIIR
jgi:hypothetical protein